MIPNCIDIEVYKPIQKEEARRICNLPMDKRLILLSAFSATTDQRKGYQYLVPAIQELARQGWAAKAEVVVLGASRPVEETDLGMSVSYIPHLHDEHTQVLLYSACDVLVAPSKQENLSNTVLESLTCGTPVVAFDIGGMPDLIRHGFNGYLAKPFESQDLAAGIAWILESAERQVELSLSARRESVDRYRFSVVAQQYERLYRELLQ